ncbi:Signal peptide peptidase-like 2B [Oopsacas minuta]|uniref:Signal peptide peptidase-like 2B n=1 Tax=Oopsacas minuta TaxID=111878 RepID=A0AAV7JS54_9METZ|nr:Signal peptide peptidase-like 2B [Oopsacas minuta]
MLYDRLICLVCSLFALLNPIYGEFVYVTFESVTLRNEAEVVSNSVCGEFSALSGALPSPEPVEVISFRSYGCDTLANKSMRLIDENVLFIVRGSCSFDTKIIQAANANASMLLVASAYPLPIPNLNSTIIDNYTIPLIIVPKSSFKLVSSADYTTVSIELVNTPSLNVNKIVLFFIALIPLILGSILGGCDIEFLKYGLLQRKGEVDLSNLVIFSQEEEEKQFGLFIYIVFLLGAMIAFLLGLYFFYEYFVWIAMIIFCISTSIAIYSVFSPFIAQIKYITCRIPANEFPILKNRPDPKFFILSLTSVILSLWWILCRQSYYAWILQDILGCFLITYMLSILQFKSSISFLIPLLCVLVVYDVFFVFITPLFTTDGRSIMEYVAFGPDVSSRLSNSNFSIQEVVPYTPTDNENIPFLFLIPHLTLTPQEVACQFPQIFIAGLGFGDVALPGLFLSYCLYYDNLRERKFKLTYLICILSYMVSLALAFIISVVTKMGQPALLYIVPSILASTLLLTIVRGDFKDFLFGKANTSPFLMAEADYSSEEDKVDLNFIANKL